ncbi:hypothetical protein SDC9_203409 [bioreactor metagenome]|uniref:Uncharacterized protein n=1 Tax=bioreactor metagenome TaxID=1076179 RepID=A0A645IWC6_9ZZZZ
MYFGLIGYAAPSRWPPLPETILARTLIICEDTDVGRYLISNFGGKGFWNAVVVFISVEVVPICTPEIRVGDFDLKAGDHHAYFPVMASQDAAMAFLLIFICAAIPEALSGPMHI